MKLYFEDAFKAIKGGSKARLISWKKDVYIDVYTPFEEGSMTAPYLYVTSRNGKVPWMPTQIEIFSDQWEII